MYHSTKIHKSPLVTGVYSQFAVDIVEEEDGKIYRGYVCGMENEQCWLRIGTMQQLRLISIDKLYKVGLSRSIRPEEFGDEVDLLVSIGENEPESWRPARIFDGFWCEAFSLLNVDVTMPNNAVTRYSVLDGNGSVWKRIRRQGQLGPPVTTQTFRHVLIPFSMFTHVIPNITDTLDRVQKMHQFRSHFLYSSAYKQIMFLGVVNACIAVLVAKGPGRGPTDEDILEHSISAIIQFTTIVTTSNPKNVLRIAEEMLDVIAATEDLEDPSELRFDDLYVNLRIVVLSFLDVFTQHQLRRTCKWFNHLLCCDTIQQSLCLPLNSTNVLKTLQLYSVQQLDEHQTTVTHVLCTTVTKKVRFVHLIGNWKKCLHTVVLLLRFLRVELHWLIIAENSALMFNEFFDFPNRWPMLHTNDNFITFQGTYRRAPDYAAVCHNILFQRCRFDSQPSICFKSISFLNDYNGISYASPAARSCLACCQKPFRVKLPYWHYNFAKSTTCTLSASLRAALEQFCPDLPDSDATSLLNWMSSLTADDLRRESCIWPFISLCYELWSKETPKLLDDVKKDVSTRFPTKCLLMQTLALLVPG
ncbi:uncharacterized protein LOC129596229 isoform X2 [Paramacrobiotus metropolitanus]|uniref:uncharacterized protein LOC129596229 isoform X2 n=1 Tax=Paramacrobiotus metropolitanus TaxID=2943436 RepID=UPI0024461E07|nr:uncharacterized protein LOC129596229 isoform X2 [Paramacrobiotus metropolitanus]